MPVEPYNPRLPIQLGKRFSEDPEFRMNFITNLRASLVEYPQDISEVREAFVAGTQAAVPKKLAIAFGIAGIVSLLLLLRD